MKMLFMLRDSFYEANPGLLEEASKLGEVVHLYTDKGISVDELKQAVADVDVIVVAVVKIDKEIIDAAPRLKYIMKFGSGYDNIDHLYAREKGIPVTNIPGQNAEAVADHAFGLLLSAARKIPLKDREIKSGHWELGMGSEIFSKDLGIVGFGTIGKAIAKRAAGFGMRITAYGNYRDEDAAKRLGVEFMPLEELLATSDAVVICTSLSNENRHMFNRDRFLRMKPTAILINISRGGLIDEEALLWALKEGHIQAAGLDVFTEEPSHSELACLPNVIATPHIGGSTYEALERMKKGAIVNLTRFKQGEQLGNLVN